MTTWADLNATDRDVLIGVGALDDACGQDLRTFLSEDLSWTAVSNAHVYPALSRLSARGLLTKEADVEDPRAHSYELTTAGETLLSDRRDRLGEAAPITAGGGDD